MNIALPDTLTPFARALLGQGLLPDGMAACPHYSVASALDIYRNNYRGNLHGALAAAYPVIEQIVGADFFRMLVYQFIDHHPSRSGNLHHYGAALADFLTTFIPAQTLPYLADVATLEWACHVAYYAADSSSFEVTRLQSIPPEQYANLVWRCAPASQVCYSNYPVAIIWQAHQSDTFHDPINLDSGGGSVLVNRIAGTVEVTPLTAAQADWLQRLQSGTAMGAATHATLATYPDFDLSATLSYFVTQGVLIDFV